MKPLALIMFFLLLGVTSWIAWDSHNQATGARNELEMYQRREAAAKRFPGGTSKESVAQQNEMLLKEQQLLAQQNATTVPNSNSPIPGSLPQNNNAAVAPPPIQPVLPPPVSAPPPLSPLQHKVMALPALAKVIEYNKDFGFVIINAGSTKNVSSGSIFLLRRGSAIVARIKIGDVDNTSSVGSIDPQSVPAGVTILAEDTEAGVKGDDVIQNLPPEA